jgi:[ribosomal protein S5]-alanine N-acetyltransferase
MELITDRLLLREFVEEDWAAVLAYQSDSRYLRFYHWTERNETDVRGFVRMFLRQQQEQPRLKYQLAIIRQADGRLIGNCGVRIRDSGSRHGDIGYEIAADEWGQGYATEAARAMMAFGFNELKLHRVWANCLAENIASARVLEKLGMQLEGRLRENEWFKGRWWDTLYYAILEQEWQGRP